MWVIDIKCHISDFYLCIWLIFNFSVLWEQIRFFKENIMYGVSSTCFANLHPNPKQNNHLQHYVTLDEHNLKYLERKILLLNLLLLPLNSIFRSNRHAEADLWTDSQRRSRTRLFTCPQGRSRLHQLTSYSYMRPFVTKSIIIVG